MVDLTRINSQYIQETGKAKPEKQKNPALKWAKKQKPNAASACNAITQKAKVRGAHVQGHYELYSEFQTHLSHKVGPVPVLSVGRSQQRGTKQSMDYRSHSMPAQKGQGLELDPQHQRKKNTQKLFKIQTANK